VGRLLGNPARQQEGAADDQQDKDDQDQYASGQCALRVNKCDGGFCPTLRAYV
jgi:hypothetical protein